MRTVEQGNTIVWVVLASVFFAATSELPAQHTIFIDDPRDVAHLDKALDAGKVPSVASWLAAEQISLLEGSVSFRLPGGVVLSREPHSIMTTGATYVTLVMTPERVSLRISPGVLIDVTWPMSNVRWGGLDYDRTREVVSNVLVSDTQDLAFSASGRAESALTEWFRSVISKTPLARADYDPLHDPDPEAILGAIFLQIDMESGTGEDAIRLDALTHPSFGVKVSPRNTLRYEMSNYGVEIPPGAEVWFRLNVAGTGLDLAKQRIRLKSLQVEGDDIVLSDGQEKLVGLNSVLFDFRNEGSVEVIKHTPLGGLVRSAASVESSLCLLMGILTRGSRHASAAVSSEFATRGACSGFLVRGITKATLERELTRAFRKLREKFLSPKPEAVDFPGP